MGPDDPHFTSYKKEQVAILKSKGATDSELDKVENATSLKVVEEFEVAEDGSRITEDGAPGDTLEIDVFDLNAKTGKINKSKIYTKKKD